jgi:hypothetical protein
MLYKCPGRKEHFGALESAKDMYFNGTKEILCQIPTMSITKITVSM